MMVDLAKTPSFRLDGKRALVTGGGRGIGLAAASALASLGPLSRMQIAPEQGAFMTVLAKLIDARRAVEVGTFTGYSALCLARGLGPEGRLLCCDVNEEWTAIARRYWEEAGVAGRIDLRLAPAADTLRSFPPAVHE